MWARISSTRVCSLIHAAVFFECYRSIFPSMAGWVDLSFLSRPLVTSQVSATYAINESTHSLHTCHCSDKDRTSHYLKSAIFFVSNFYFTESFEFKQSCTSPFKLEETRIEKKSYLHQYARRRGGKRNYVLWRKQEQMLRRMENSLRKQSRREVQETTGNIWLEILIQVHQPQNKSRAG